MLENVYESLNARVLEWIVPGGVVWVLLQTNRVGYCALREDKLALGKPVTPALLALC